MNPDNIRIVLVNTSHPGNIGGVARAMKNMGLSRLTLVAPKQFPHEQAQWRAASAADILATARVVDTVAEAVADCQFVVGTSVSPGPCWMRASAQKKWRRRLCANKWRCCLVGRTGG